MKQDGIFDDINLDGLWPIAAVLFATDAVKAIARRLPRVRASVGRSDNGSMLWGAWEIDRRSARARGIVGPVEWSIGIEARER